MFRTRTLFVAALLMFVTVGSVVAGTAISNQEVYISRRGLAGGSARGVLWQVRNSADSNQYIGCKTMGPITWCAARDRDGYVKSCYSNEAYIAETLRAVEPTSLLSFAVTVRDGHCTTVSVDNDSRYLPGPSTLPVTPSPGTVY